MTEYQVLEDDVNDDDLTEATAAAAPQADNDALRSLQTTVMAQAGAVLDAAPVPTDGRVVADRDGVVHRAADRVYAAYMMDVAEVRFIQAWGEMTQEVHATARDKGWWDDPCNDGEKIALMHSELSEALEALREGNPMSEKVGLPHVTCVEEEMADVIIRIMDWAQYNGFDIGSAVVKKAQYNRKRPYKHGGKKF